MKHNYVIWHKLSLTGAYLIYWTVLLYNYNGCLNYV